MPGGRPSSFTTEIADRICEKLADGESLRTICAEEGMPSKGTVCRWLATNTEFRDQYARAREAQAEFYADEITDIADDGTNDWIEKRSRDGVPIGYVVNGEAVQRSKLRVDARKWVASKLLPKVYGDRVEATLKNADGETFKTEEVGELGNRVVFALMKGIDAET